MSVEVQISLLMSLSFYLFEIPSFSFFLSFFLSFFQISSFSFISIKSNFFYRQKKKKKTPEDILVKLMNKRISVCLSLL